MKKRTLLKRIIYALSLILCLEVGLVMYKINSGANAFARNLDLGNKYLLSEDYDSAISAFSKAIEIDSMNADAYIGRGDAYKAKGDYASAWEDYEKAQELSGNPDLIRDKIGLTEISIVSEDGSGVDGASVKLSGSDHSYEFVTNSSGRISEVIFPEKYKMEVVKDKFDPVEVELSTEEGGTEIGQIQLQRAIDLSAPILQVENVHKEGKNGLCRMEYSRVSLACGTETVFPKLAEALTAYSDEEFAAVEKTYNELLADTVHKGMELYVDMSLSLERSDENVLSLHYAYDDYLGGAHGYYWDGGATFDPKTGARLRLGDICKDTGELARIVVSALYAEDASRFSVSQAEMVKNILDIMLNPENMVNWFCTPEGLRVIFPPYSISYFAAGQPDVVVRYADYPHIFNESYVSMQDAYVVYDLTEGLSARFDYDNDGSMNTINLSNNFFQGEWPSSTYRNFKISIDNGKVCEQPTAEYSKAHNYRIKSNGRFLYVVETENVDGANTSYIFDITNGTAVLTGSMSDGVYGQSTDNAERSVIIQSPHPDMILFGGDAQNRWAVSSDGKLSAVSSR